MILSLMSIHYIELSLSKDCKLQFKVCSQDDYTDLLPFHGNFFLLLTITYGRKNLQMWVYKWIGDRLHRLGTEIKIGLDKPA